MENYLWIVWTILGAVLVIAEIFTTGFVLLWFGIGALAAAFAGLLRSRATAAVPTYATVPTTLADVGLSVSATGPVVAPTSEPLNFRVGGRVADIPVEAGQTVHGGNVLARLDDSNLRLQFGQAQATLRQQQAALAKLQAGATPEQRQVAENQVEAAAQAVGDAAQHIRRDHDVEGPLRRRPFELQHPPLKPPPLPRTLMLARAPGRRVKR